MDAVAVSEEIAVERKQARRLLYVLVAIGLFFFVELAGARAAQSDVLQADAFHLLMDVGALGVSLIAMRIASRRPSLRFTFGLRRVEPLAALINGVMVLAVAQEIVRDSLEHLAHPNTPRPKIMLIVAAAALVVNGLSAWLLHGAMHVHGAHGHDHGPPSNHHHDNHHDHDHHDHDHHDHAHHQDHHEHREAPHEEDDEGPHPDAHAHHLNLRGAWLHLLGDALGSLAALLAGLGMMYGAPTYVDPIASFLVVAILLVGAFRLLRDAGLVLLDAAPPRLPVARVRKMVLDHPGVKSVHALHVWSLGTGHDAVTVHVTADGADPNLGTALGDVLRAKFHAEYVTVQVDVVAG